jgi:trehalose 6-phosphate phosphatase
MTAALENIVLPEGLPDAGSLTDWAFFFDIDGTLLDIAASPDAIRVPDGLVRDLSLLDQKLGGALALVTGRSIAFVDTLFPDARFPVAGLHGAERRGADGRVTEVELTPDFLNAKAELERRAVRWPAFLVEDKHAAIAIHYRRAPHLGDEARRLMDEIAALAGPGWTVQEGKMVVELRPAAHDKGQVLETFMAVPPFSDRRPLVFGDDLTDEAMFETANAKGGLSIRIGSPGERPSAAALYMESPAALRAWLGNITGQKKE